MRALIVSYSVVVEASLRNGTSNLGSSKSVDDTSTSVDSEIRQYRRRQRWRITTDSLGGVDEAQASWPHADGGAKLVIQLAVECRLGQAAGLCHGEGLQLMYGAGEE